ncbi:hypothetical protein CJ030_MR3G024349 [Morella rubra]|uniref:CLAVATA3/ESR (CLE)-related protein 44 n=1 Tax=Morella rubra TaxID=262757 RepID=A0A6A1W758_9ROSI|nr:hypothetical protein CJ030_MR3G024349 [Morella rubra]
MRSSLRDLFCRFALICFLILMCSSMSLLQGMEVCERDRYQTRRLLVSSTPLPANSLTKRDEGVKDPKKSVDTSLRKAPSSKSNPSQNKRL